MTKYFIVLISLIVFFSHCNQADLPDIDSPNIYDKDGIFFKYPGNWYIKKEIGKTDESPLIKFIKLQSKDDIVLLIQVFPVMNVHINKFVNEFRKNREKEIQSQRTYNIKFLKYYEQFEELEKDIMMKPHRGLKESFEIEKNKEKLIYNCSYFIYEDEDYTIPIIAQCLKRDWAIVEKGFNLVYSSLNIKKK